MLAKACVAVGFGEKFQRDLRSEGQSLFDQVLAIGVVNWCSQGVSLKGEGEVVEVTRVEVVLEAELAVLIEDLVEELSWLVGGSHGCEVINGVFLACWLFVLLLLLLLFLW